jgi:hypothetical protein
LRKLKLDEIPDNRDDNGIEVASVGALLLLLTLVGFVASAADHQFILMTFGMGAFFMILGLLIYIYARIKK